MIKVDCQIDKDWDVSNGTITKAVKDQLLKRGVTDATIEVETIGIKAMTALNKKHLNKLGATDVLSFPLPKIPKSENLLGTIVLCRDIIQKNCQANGVKFKDETDRMIRHGVDHLVGIHHK